MICRESGKSLAELMMVFVIIAIGGSIAIANYRAGVQNEQVKNVYNSIDTIVGALRLYYLDYDPHAAAAPRLADLEDLGYIKASDLYLHSKLSYRIVGSEPSSLKINVNDSLDQDIGRDIRCDLDIYDDYPGFSCSET